MNLRKRLDREATLPRGNPASRTPGNRGCIVDAPIKSAQ
jgi:hypothetical protein